MKRIAGLLLLLLALSLLLCGCSAIGTKAASMALIYDTTVIISLLLLIGYCCLIRKKDIWLLLLFSSVFVVNVGYLTLALSRSLEEALLANRVAYLGSVCLPMSMLMIIINACRLNYKKWFPGLLLAIGALEFLVAASPGYLDIYYKEATLSVVNGIAVLDKVYGPWHCSYLFFLLAYFAGTTGVIIYAAAKRKIASPVHVFILAAAVFVNMGVWLLEQLVRIDIELLSVSYIISELFLLCFYLLMQEGAAPPEQKSPAEPATADTPAGDSPPPQESIPAPDELPAAEEPAAVKTFEERCAFFASQLSRLTPTERIIYNAYLSGAGTKDILASLNIKENTLKYHNKNIYGKLGVSSRKELLEIAAALKE